MTSSRRSAGSFPRTKHNSEMKPSSPPQRRIAPAQVPTDLGSDASKSIATALNALLADMFALYLKTKNFHWHMSGPHFRDFHLLLDEHANKIFAATDTIAERVRKVGAPTVRSIGDISRRQRLLDNDADDMPALQMLAELRDDNLQLGAYLREAHGVCEEHGDVATAGFLEGWIDEAEQRVWYLFEACSEAGPPGSIQRDRTLETPAGLALSGRTRPRRLAKN